MTTKTKFSPLLTKAFLFLPNHLSDWESAKLFEPALIKFYRHNFPTQNVLFFDAHSKRLEPNLLRRLEKTTSKAEMLFVFPCVRIGKSMLLGLQKKYPEAIFVIHVFGNFLSNADFWMNFPGRVKFIAPSERHKNLIIDVVGSRHSVFVLPLKGSSIRHRKKEIRSVVRNKLQIPQKAHVFIYAGRINYFKNVHHLIHNFLKFRKTKAGRHCRLIICGYMDDTGDKLLNFHPVLGHAFLALKAAIENSEDTASIKFLGFQSQKNVDRLLSASDTFVSLSTYSGEDFGVAAGTALKSGLSAILTDWGGHKDLAIRYKNQVKLTKVVLKDYFKPESKSFLQSLRDCTQNPTTRASMNKKLHFDKFTPQDIQNVFNSVEGEKFLQPAGKLRKEKYLLEKGSERKFDLFNLPLVIKALNKSYVSSPMDCRQARGRVKASLTADATLDQTFWPETKLILNENPIVFLTQLRHLSTRSTQLIFLRDGRARLDHEKLSNLSNRKNKLVFLSEDMKNLFSESSSNFGYYRMTPICRARDRKKLIVNFVQAQSQKEAKLLVDQFLKLLNRRQKSFDEIFLLKKPNNTENKFRNTVVRANPKIAFKELAWLNFIQMTDLESYNYIELNSMKEVAVTYTKHLALSRGAQVIAKELSKKAPDIVSQLSPYHRLEIQFPTKLSDAEKKEYSKLFLQQGLEIFQF